MPSVWAIPHTASAFGATRIAGFSEPSWKPWRYLHSRGARLTVSRLPAPTPKQGVGHDGRVGWWSRMGDVVVMIMAMAGFWALVIGATMALFRGVRCDPAVRRRTNPSLRMAGDAASGSVASSARTVPVRHDSTLPAVEPSWTPPGSPSPGPSANLHGKPAQTFVRRADCEGMSEVETTPSWGRQGRGAAGGGAPTQGAA